MTAETFTPEHVRLIYDRYRDANRRFAGEQSDENWKLYTHCRRCGSDALVAVNGNANCHYYGNTVALCQDCAEELASSLVRALNLVGA